MKTLILEDEAHNQAFLQLSLQQHCPQVQVLAQAQGVAEALALFRQYLPELILLDVELPDGTGFDFFGAIAAALAQNHLHHRIRSLCLAGHSLQCD